MTPLPHLQMRCRVEPYLVISHKAAVIGTVVEHGGLPARCRMLSIKERCKTRNTAASRCEAVQCQVGDVSHSDRHPELKADLSPAYPLFVTGVRS